MKKKKFLYANHKKKYLQQGDREVEVEEAGPLEGDPPEGGFVDLVHPQKKNSVSMALE